MSTFLLWLGIVMERVGYWLARWGNDLQFRGWSRKVFRAEREYRRVRMPLKVSGRTGK